MFWCKCKLMVYGIIPFGVNENLVHVMNFQFRMYIFVLFVPRLSQKWGTLKLIRLSVCPSVRLSVTKTLTWLISSEVLMIQHWYLAGMIFVTSPFIWHHAMTLTLTYFKVKVVAGRGTTILWICLSADTGLDDQLVHCTYDFVTVALQSIVSSTTPSPKDLKTNSRWKK